MRKVLMAGGAFALAIGLMGALQAGDENKEKYDVTKNPGACEGAIVKLFKNEKLIEFKVEKVFKEAAPVRRGDEGKKDAIKEGQVIFLHVVDARIFDEEGKELKREDKTAWFSRDAGWSALKEGQRLKADYAGTHMMPAPKDFPKDARAGGDILVYHVDQIKILPAAK
jgi:hypothetical protein